MKRLCNVFFFVLLLFSVVRPSQGYAIEAQSKFKNKNLISSTVVIECSGGQKADSTKHTFAGSVYDVTFPWSECTVSFRSRCHAPPNGAKDCGSCTWKGNGFYKNVVIEGSSESTISCKAYGHWLP